MPRMNAGRRRPSIVVSADHKRIIWHLRANGPTSRSSLAERLGIHNASMTRMTRELLGLGLVEESDSSVDGARGRPIIPIAISRQGGYSAGATVHPGWLELVLVDFSGAVIARDSEVFSSDDPRAFLELLERKLHDIISSSGLLTTRFFGMGIAIPGPVDSLTGKWRPVEWLRGWRTIDLPDYFESYLGFPVWVENDGALAGLADYYDCGLIHSRQTALTFFIGHGVGGGVILNGECLRGDHGNAGDIGRLFPIEAPRPSGLDLIATLNAAGEDVQSLRDVGALVDRHPELIRAWAERVACQISGVASAGVAWFDPGAIIVSGALPSPLLRIIGERVSIADWVGGREWLGTPIFHVSQLGSWAVPIGAGLLPVHRLLADE